MNVVGIIQARMSSTRLPKKALKKVNDKELLLYLIERLQKANYMDSFVVATSNESTDDPIVSFCENKGINFFRGNLENVAGRFFDFLNLNEDIDAFVRISADSPLLDYNIVDKGIKIFRESKADMVTNTFPKTFPSGQSVEIIDKFFFMKYYPQIKVKSHREHVTKFFYENYNQFEIINFTNDSDMSDINLSIDTKEDFSRFKKILKMMSGEKEYYGFKEIYEFAKL